MSDSTTNVIDFRIKILSFFCLTKLTVRSILQVEVVDVMRAATDHQKKRLLIFHRITLGGQTILITFSVILSPCIIQPRSINGLKLRLNATWTSLPTHEHARQVLGNLEVHLTKSVAFNNNTLRK